MAAIVNQVELSGWGRYPRRMAQVVIPQNIAEVRPPAEQTMIARGLGRSYGDAAISSDGVVLLSERLNDVGSFDETTGVLKAEAGTSLAEIIETFVPRGWFPSVVPGTKFVSLGGCVAADIHGKNHHHAGTFGRHVTELEIVCADSSSVRCSPQANAELFWATVGGMGLTGIMTEAAIKMLPVESPFMIVQNKPAKDLEISLSMLEDKSWDDDYSVAWIDCVAGPKLGRSVLIRGHHARQKELPGSLQSIMANQKTSEHKLPFGFPSWALNRFAMAAFNEAFYRRQGRRTEPFVDTLERFFFPLDRIAHWNRMYGNRGFVQYQCVLPPSQSERGLQELFDELKRRGRSSFLSVLKRFGPEGEGLLSFPIEGYTLTLDFPIRDEGLFPFLDRLDEIVLKYGGRVYLAKDARMRAETFHAMYPRLAEWQRIKARVDPENRFESDLSRRLRMNELVG